MPFWQQLPFGTVGDDCHFLRVSVNPTELGVLRAKVKFTYLASV